MPVSNAVPNTADAAQRHAGVSVRSSPPVPSTMNANTAATAEPVASPPTRPSPSPTSARPAAPGGEARAVLALLARSLAHERFARAAAAVVAELAVQLRCERVCIGLGSPGRVKVRAASGVAELRQQQDLVRNIAAVMEEALAQRNVIVYPMPPSGKPSVTLAHATLSQANGRLAICSLPIVSAEHVVGAIVLERRDAFDARTLDMAKDAALFVGPVLALKFRAEALLRGRLDGNDNAARATTGSARPSASPMRLAALASAVTLAVLACWPATLRVVAPARVEGAVQRVIAAPVDGFVRAVSVRPGEAVQAGQLLVQLEDQDLALEREKWLAEIAQLDKQYGEALSRDDAATIVIARSKLEQAQTQLELAQRQLERARLLAPFDGVLISGDLKHSIGMPVKRGQELMTVGVQQGFRVVAEIDERDVALVQVGQAARVLFAAQSDRPVAFKVTRIAPVALAADGRNVFEVEGELADAAAAPLFQHGLRGVAKIEIDKRLLGAVGWYHASHWARRLWWRVVA
jgi:hypothetical protein